VIAGVGYMHICTKHEDTHNFAARDQSALSFVYSISSPAKDGVLLLTGCDRKLAT
jgi:dihydroxyacid dehydratase/phosphogluconate dehydratase